VSSARPEFATTDDKLISWARSNKQISQDEVRCCRRPRRRCWRFRPLQRHLHH
jgi:hypothetical protein